MPDHSSRPIIEIPSLETFRKVRQLRGGTGFIALSPLSAGCAFGIPWWKTVLDHQPAESILDCGASAALALQALEQGITRVVCRDFRSAVPAELQERILPHRPDAFAPGLPPWPAILRQRLMALGTDAWERTGPPPGRNADEP